VAIDHPDGDHPHGALSLTYFLGKRESLFRPSTARASWRCRDSSDGGFVGGFEGLLFGLLLFVAGTLLVSYAWAVVDTKTATEAAARQAAVTYVQAPSAAAAFASARQAAEVALAGYGRDPGRSRVTLVAGSFGRCQRITISVTYPSPLLVLPFVGRIGSGERVRADRSELVDPYRSGIPGTAACG